VVWDFARTGLGIYAGCIAVIGYSFGRLSLLGRVLYGVLSFLVLVPTSSGRAFWRRACLQRSASRCSRRTTCAGGRAGRHRRTPDAQNRYSSVRSRITGR
jgi:hypothetical protein